MTTPDDIECYVCADSTAPLLTGLCRCTERHIHAECQRRLVETLERDGRCSVCRQAYNNIDVRHTRNLNRQRVGLRCLTGIFVGSGCMSTVIATQHIFVYFNLTARADLDASACWPICVNSTNSSCVPGDNFSAAGVCIGMRIMLDRLLEAGLFVCLIMSSLCLFAGLYFQQLSRRLPKYHDRREIHFSSSDASDTPGLASVSLDEACAQSAETTAQAL